MRDWKALGKKLSKFGEVINDNRIAFSKLAEESGLDKSTITKAITYGKDGTLSRSTKIRLVRAMNRLIGSSFCAEDFWS